MSYCWLYGCCVESLFIIYLLLLLLFGGYVIDGNAILIL